MISNDQYNAISNLSSPFFCSSCIQMVPVALRCYDSQSYFDSKVSILEKSMSKIQQTESNLCEFVKNVESQLEKHEKAITTLFNDHKTTQMSIAPSPTPITEESVANIAASVTAVQKEKEKRQLNVIIHSIAESSANEGPSRKEDDIG